MNLKFQVLQILIIVGRIIVTIIVGEDGEVYHMVQSIEEELLMMNQLIKNHIFMKKEN